MPAKRVETAKVRVQREAIESSRRVESSGIQEEGYCRQMFQGQGLTETGATSLRGSSVQKTRTRKACMQLEDQVSPS